MLCVCFLFVCVSVNNIAEILVNGFSWNFQDRSGMMHNQFGTFGSNPLGTGFSLLCFQIRACWQHYGKTDELIFMKFPTKVRHETSNDLYCFLDAAVNPLNPGSLFAISWIRVCYGKTRERIFMKFSWNGRDVPRNNRLDCFTPA